ncbi:MAG: Fic family protein [Gammaproteobacteria bacterium]|nr:Fic family protein [Gammaproteobacteria bacterium]
MSPVHYRSEGFPPEDRLDWRRLAPLMGPAAAAVARYDCALARVPTSRALLAGLRVREAVWSSRIEDIFTSVTEVLEMRAGLPPTNPYARDDAHEVVRHLAAERRMRKMLDELPLSPRIIRKAHSLLLTGPRGWSKSPGAFRRAPVWIGAPGSTLETATFVPAPANQVQDAMSAWERYIHADARDRLVQIAVQHARFEAIHPFLDGNGRMGRMLIPVLMHQYGLIRAPVFGLSARIAARRSFYYDGLLGVSRDDDWTGWCLYALDAMRNQAREGVTVVEAILALRTEVEAVLANRARAHHPARALDRLFECPVFRVSDFVSAGDIPPRTARRLLWQLRDAEVLEEAAPASGSRSAILGFSRLLEILDAP